ncbi:hypothetical protein [Micromonospora globispora]|uniref:hypothetical protein n=1 Tax=Micromonospora globispora TaxID=1450148 RepID=UPI000F4ECB73|nr:hypothetical protein [Micromonospora globispora]
MWGAPALAQEGLHFVGTPTVEATKTTTEAFLTATGEVAGAGTGGTATLSATAVVTSGCINPGSKDHEPSGLQRTTTTVTGSEEFTTRQGRGSFTVVTSSVSPGTCPGKMTPVLVDVVFEDVTLTVEAQTGTITYDFGTVDPV